MKDGFKSIKDILKEVGEEEGLSYTEMEDIWIHQREYIKNKMEEEEVYAIYIPYIGTLSLSVYQFNREIKYKNKAYYAKFIEKVDKLINHSNFSFYGNSHKKKTGVSRLVRSLIKNFEVENKSKKHYSVHKRCWELIAKYSNGILIKK